MEAGSDVSQRVLQAARTLFFARGFSGTSLRAIAGAAGTSESGVLRLFGSKRGLLRAVYGSCWEEINARVDEAMAAVSGEDSDPRDLLIHLMRAVLRCYQEEPAMMGFVLSHFCYSETCGLVPLEDVDPAICQKAGREYHRYLGRIHDLCSQVARNDAGYAEMGVNPNSLAFAFISLIHGIETGWYVSALEEGSVLPEVTLEDALASARLLLYPGSPTQ